MKERGLPQKHFSRNPASPNLILPFNLALSWPEQAMASGNGDKGLVTNHVLPTDEMIYAQFNKGLQ
jgi:hypothetical protein